jgi:hypothetical protein
MLEELALSLGLERGAEKGWLGISPESNVESSRSFS